MRCPKCGFISFDHLTSCTNCGRDISEVASELQGTSIKVETPMFLSGALAALSESEGSFEEHAMDAEVDEGIDFDMEMEAEEEESVETGSAEDDVDFSFEEEAEEFEVVEEAETTLAAPASEEEPDESIEELDFMGASDEEEEGGLEFDLEDFMEDIDDDKSKTSANEDANQIDFDLDNENK